MRINKQQIIDYYDSSEVDYKLLWNLRRSHAIHFGYWDKSVKNLPQALERENKILADKAGIKNTDVVLDAGCGVGGSSIFLAKNFGCKVTGITLSRKQVLAAVRNAKQNGVEFLTEFLEMDFEKMNFRDKSFNVVWAIESVCHADNKSKFIEEAYRILKPGGRLIIADGFAVKKTYTKPEREIMKKWLNGWGVNFLETKENFEKQLKKSRFHNISFLNATDHVLPSSKRMYLYSFPAMFFGMIAEFFGIRKKVQTRNIIAALHQYEALKSNLWIYGIVYAKK